MGVNREEVVGSGGKFDFIGHVAETLFKRYMYMSVPELPKLMNELGFKTDCNSEYAVKRGSYELIRAAYDRMLEKHGGFRQSPGFAFLPKDLSPSAGKFRDRHSPRPQ